jgi:glycosyltransferase involved in cell wall biosynthesis
MSGIHQFVPMLHRGDAVGRHTLHLRDRMVARGITSRIYVELVDPETATEAEVTSSYIEQSEPGDVLLYQFATASQLAGWLHSRPERLVVNFHNVTPPEYFAPWDNPLARLQLQARSELALLAPRAALAVAVSAHNEAELVQAGYRTTAVVPPAAMLPSDGAVRTATDGGHGGPGRGARWLAVGRLAPNKAIEHALMALLVTRAHHDPAATMEIVGQSVVPAYTGALRRFAADLGLRTAVVFRGQISDAELDASMARADVLVVTSEHEGFGVPVLEALARGLPVVANRAGALPEVVGNAGVLVDAADPYQLARAIADLLGDAPRQRELAAAGSVQLAALDLGTAADRLIDLVAALN